MLRKYGQHLLGAVITHSAQSAGLEALLALPRATNSAPQHSVRRPEGPNSLQPRGRTVDTVRTEAAGCSPYRVPQ
jgi:hypothetical protein